MATLAQYLARITPQHAGKPNFMATIAATMGPIADAQALLASIPPAFDIDSAIGAQEDVVGLWVGRSREIPVPIAAPWFAFDDPIHGWDRAPWNVPGVGVGDTLAALGDGDYRQLLYAKRSANSWDGTATSAQAILTAFVTLPGALVFVEDKGDGSMTVGVAGALPSIVDLEILGQDLIPLKPSGIGFHVHVASVNGSALFGFDVENSLVSGWDAGAWGVSPDYAAQNLS